MKVTTITPKQFIDGTWAADCARKKRWRTPMRFVRQIDLSNRKKNDSHHPDIYSSATYMVRYNDAWLLGKFTQQWYGWNFEWPLSIMVGVQLSSTGITEVWEVEFK